MKKISNRKEGKKKNKKLKKIYIYIYHEFDTYFHKEIFSISSCTG